MTPSLVRLGDRRCHGRARRRATSSPGAQMRLADASDRAAFRSWFVLLADAQFEQPARRSDRLRGAGPLRVPRGAAGAHARVGAPRRAAVHADISRCAFGARSRRRTAGRSSACRPAPARATPSSPTRARSSASTRARSAATSPRSQPGDLLYFHQPEQAQPDHLMVFVGRSFFDPERSRLGRLSHRTDARRPRRSAQGAPSRSAAAPVATLAPA